MPVDEARVRRAIGDVRDPSLRRSLAETGLLADLAVHDDALTVGIAAPESPWRQWPELTRRIKAAAAGAGIDPERVEVLGRPMNDDEVEVLYRVLKGPQAAHENAGQAGHGHAAGPSTSAPFMEPDAKTRVLGISSGKGGVGKSSVTVNLAISLTKLGHEVAILDADVYGFSVPKMLGITDDPIAIERDLMIPPVAHDVACISMDYFVPEDKALIWRGPMLHKALEEFLNNVYWGEPDYLLFDMPPGTGDVALSMAQYLPRAEMYVVTTPQAAAQRVAKKSAQMARDPKINLSLAGIIENMSWFTGDDGKRYELFGSGGGQSLADDLGVPLIGQIPLVPELREGGDIGVPVTIADPSSEASLAFEGIAKWVEGHGPRRIVPKGLKLI
ncbi:MAG: ATP-binding protein involved in chromosome partitioning [Actinomycetota bacterium]|nr:ATP-binding protein involved in chromosome partitioning [Actinomycetota bacterium]